MKKVLLVDDDAVVLLVYQEGLSARGFEVQAAGDGLAAIKKLEEFKPDVMVLDLMMPRFTGVDVLRHAKSKPALAKLPIIVLSNSYMNELAREAATLGADKALLKVSCSPSILHRAITALLEGQPWPDDLAPLLAAPEGAPAPLRKPDGLPKPAPKPAPAPVPPPPRSIPSAPPDSPVADDRELRAKARQDFLEQAPDTCASLRSLFQTCAAVKSELERGMRLQNFYRKVHFLTATAGLAECLEIALLASALEALVFQVMDRPDRLSPSVLRTIATTLDFLGTLFDRARNAQPQPLPPARVLAVDDDPVCNRLAVAALRQAQLQAKSTEDPLKALQWLQESRYDLVMLDVDMPAIDGFEVCRRLRALPGYEKTPVIYVTSLNDFETRSRSVLVGAVDLISKPVLPMELAVKAITHLLQAR